MPTRIQGLAGLEELAGKPLGASDWCTLDYDDIKAFADATGDQQWIHVDRERIRHESPFGVPIAHGYYSVARIGGLFRKVVEPIGFALTINYGMNKVRFPAPLKEGDRYRLSLVLASVKSLEGVGEGVFTATIEIEGQSKPACVAEVVYRFVP